MLGPRFRGDEVQLPIGIKRLRLTLQNAMY